MCTIEDLVDIPAAGFPCWSPDGTRIAYIFEQPGAGWRRTASTQNDVLSTQHFTVPSSRHPL